MKINRSVELKCAISELPKREKRSFFSDIGNWFEDAADDVGEFVSNIDLKPAGKAIEGAANDVSDFVSNIDFKGAADDVGEFVGDAAETVGDAATSVWVATKDGIDNLGKGKFELQ